MTESHETKPGLRGTLLEKSGVVVVDKPAGLTSHDVVGRLRRILGTRKIGHSGTLDPMATGVLFLGVERGTRFLAHVVTHDKRYQATVELGATTLTDDIEGDVLHQATQEQINDVEVASIEAALDQQIGEIMQRPTSVSSIKIDGRRAHELVREGKEVILPERPVTVYSLTRSGVVKKETENGIRWTVDIDVHCSSGTYIRAIARDVGEAVGIGGYLSKLRRTAVGPFTIDEATTLEELAKNPALTMSLDEAMIRCFPTRAVTEDQARDLSLGRWLEPVGKKEVYAAVAPNNQAIALIKEQGKRASTVFVARPDGMK